MQVQVKITPDLTMTIEGEKQIDIFAELATLQEVFGQSKCGKCGCTDIRYVVREVDDNKYYELHCLNCRSVLAFGQHKKGGSLFPKRKVKGDDGIDKWLPNNGWVKYDPATKTRG